MKRWVLLSGFLVLSLSAARADEVFLRGDVNNDGVTSVQDAVAVVNELIDGGSRLLDLTAPFSSVALMSPTSLAEGEPGSSQQLYLDVNGDNYLSPVDVMAVIERVRAEGEDTTPPLVVYSHFFVPACASIA